LAELKAHLSGAKIVLRSKTRELVVHEFHGLMLAHFAFRGLMHEAALKANEDRDRRSFLDSLRVLRRRMASFVSIPPQGRRAFHDAVLDEILNEQYFGLGRCRAELARRVDDHRDAIAVGCRHPMDFCDELGI
jgi:hypothetical protein